MRGQICRIVNWPAQEYKMFNTFQHDLAWTGQRLNGVHWLHHRYVLRQLQMFSSQSDMARGSRVLHSVGTEHGPYVCRLIGVWPKHGGWCATRTISSSCCTLYLGHQRLVHCQLHLHMSWETVLVEVTPASWMIVVWSYWELLRQLKVFIAA